MLHALPSQWIIELVPQIIYSVAACYIEMEGYPCLIACLIAVQVKVLLGPHIYAVKPSNSLWTVSGDSVSGTKIE